MAARPPDLSDWYTRRGLQVKGGGITLQRGGAIKVGQTDYNVGSGFSLGYSGNNYKFSIGNSATGNYLTWDGNTLSVAGSITLSNVPWSTVTGTGKPSDNADVTISAVNGGLNVTGGGITLSGGGSVKGGQTSYDTGTGFFLGYSGGYKFSIGNSTGNKLTWDGTTLGIIGQFVGGAIKLGTGHTPNGYALEISAGTNSPVYADNVYGGILHGDNYYVQTTNAVYGLSYGNIEGIYGIVHATNTNVSAHGVRGWNANKLGGTGGIIGGANGYDRNESNCYSY